VLFERSKHLHSRIFIALMLASASSQAQTDFELGLSAYQSHAYGDAFDAWQGCANESVAACQYGLGVLYDEGRAVQADLYAALRWYERAARQGYPDAMMQLGFLYATGRGEIVQNAVLAWAWFARAAAQGAAQAAQNRDRVGELLTDTERADAQRRADQLSIEYRQQ
jgi:TPR repeat protein